MNGTESLTRCLPLQLTDHNTGTCFYFLKEVKTNPNNYDAWFDYLRLLENEGLPESVRETYERAIGNVPPAQVCVMLKYVPL